MAIVGEPRLVGHGTSSAFRAYKGLPRPNPKASGLYGNIGLPKAQKSYGNGAFILGKTLLNTNRSYSKLTDRGYFFSTGTFGAYELPKESSFGLSSGSPLIISECKKVISFATLDSARLIHVIGHPDVLRLAYELIPNRASSVQAGRSTLIGLPYYVLPLITLY